MTLVFAAVAAVNEVTVGDTKLVPLIKVPPSTTEPVKITPPPPGLKFPTAIQVTVNLYPPSLPSGKLSVVVNVAPACTGSATASTT